MDLEGFYEAAQLQEETEDEENLASYLVLLPSEGSLGIKVSKLEERGFSIENPDQVEEELQKWETLWMQTRYQGIFAGLLLLWGSTLGCLQGRLWRKNHEALAAYMKSISRRDGRLEKIWALHWGWAVLVSLGISGALFLVSVAAGVVI